MSSNENSSQFPMEALEQMLVQIIMTDEMYAREIGEVLELRYFSKPAYKHIVENVQRHLEDYKGALNQKAFQEDTLTLCENEATRMRVKELFARPLPTAPEVIWVKKEASNWCRKQKLVKALEKAIEHIGHRHVEFDSIVSDLNDAIAQGSSRQLGHVYKESKAIDERFSESFRKPVATPWEPLNNITGGGVSPGELAVILALTGVGKSHALVDIGAAAVRAGLKVAHFTFELSEVRVGKRYDARLSDTAHDELQHNRQRVDEALAKLDGSVHIKLYPNRDASIQTLRNYYNRISANGVKPDLMIVDYADIMKSGKSYENKRFEEEKIYEDLRSLAVELQVPIWTASQVNRSGMDVEVLTLKHIAECFAKANIADLFITMNRSKNCDYKALQQGNYETLGNMYVAKSRLGPDGIKFNVLVNTALSKITCLEPGTDKEEQELLAHMAKETAVQRLRRRLNEKATNDKVPKLSLVKQEEENNESQRQMPRGG